MRAGSEPCANFLPTEYTAALMLRLRQLAPGIQLDTVLEIGTGSGVVLACLLELGARQAMGVDLEPAAVACTEALLSRQGRSPQARLVQGDMWKPCAGLRFDLIATNLPQFPVLQPLDDGRLSSWSCGGADGRALIDPFLLGLPEHLAQTGLAVMTHNAFIDLPKTQRMAQALGLVAKVGSTVSVPLPAHKLDGLHPEVLKTQLGRGLHRLGEHAFADFHIVEIHHATPHAALP